MPLKEAPCLYCGERFVFVAGTHFQKDDHFGDSNAFENYKQWVAEEYNLSLDHEVFQTPGALTRPEDFEKYKHLFK